MVNNNNISTIISALSNNKEAVSGEKLAEKLGISRVAVWKKISKLQNEGYKIESGRNGYKLVESTDKPYPWELKNEANNVEYYNSLDSTMKKASQLLNYDCKNGTVIIAGSQSNGSTVLGGNWISPEGGLYLSRIRTIPFPSIYAALYCTASAYACSKILKSEFSIASQISWPGRLYCDGKKIGGVLTEYKGQGNVIQAISSGIGLNIHKSDNLPEDAISIEEAAGRQISIKEVTAALLEELKKYDKEFYSEKLLKSYNLNILEINKNVTVVRDKKYSGVIKKLSESGFLILEMENKKTIYINSGDKIIYE
ncbi:MAG: biotin--[acetyl-CoA-carboxylase] ligase [Spirochaetales bacterium]|nr:biotin--[acetyl-CoA-carboxylase] ligase [Spirochaetales bacterium]